MIEIRVVKTKKEQKDFLNFPLKLYKKNPYFVPPLYVDEKKIFHPNYFYYETCDAIYFNAYKDNKMVGRISGIIQHQYNEIHKDKRVRFTRFDSIDDLEVAKALFNAVEEWGKQNGMKTICGPLGFSDLEREGLLIDGFEEISTFEEQYNAPYYQSLIERLGYVKEVDWLERKLRAPKVRDDKLMKVSTKMMDHYHLRFGESKNIKDFINKYKDGFFEIIDITYKDIYGTVPFTDGMKKMIIDNFKLIVTTNNCPVILDENDRIVAFAICFPSIGKALQKSSGHLTPITLIKLLRAIKHPKVLDLGLIGVLPEYAQKGIASAALAFLLEKMYNGIEYCETNLNLEDNIPINNQWRRFDNVIHKRRRSFVKELK